jgi:Leucine-rich repeat (LRR) protein
LDVSDNNIKVIPPELGLLDKLQSVLYTGNPMKFMKQMGTDKLLKYLRDKLPDQSATEAPQRLSAEELSTRTIDLSDKGLTDIPKEAFQFQPVVFKASKNRIQALPDFFWDLGKNLTTLELARNQIRAFPIGFLPELRVWILPISLIAEK